MARGGVEHLIMNIYRQIDRTRIQFDFVYYDDTPYHYDEEIGALGGVIHRLARPRSPLHRFITTLNFLRQHPDYTAVHVHDVFHGGYYLLAATVSGRCRRIAHAHATETNKRLSRWGRLYQQLSIYLIRQCVTLRLACGRAAGHFLFGARPFHIVPSCIDMEHFRTAFNLQNRNYVRSALNLPTSTKILCQIGRLEEQKNPLFTLALAKELRDEQYAFHLVLIGNGQLRAVIEREIRQFKLHDYVSLLGERDDIPALMGGADVILCPSHYEGFPLVLVEAQVVGLPAIVATTVSREVDLGVGLVTFADMDSPSRWTSIIRRLQPPSGSTGERQRAIQRGGHDAARTANALLRLYTLPIGQRDTTMDNRQHVSNE